MKIRLLSFVILFILALAATAQGQEATEDLPPLIQDGITLTAPTEAGIAPEVLGLCRKVCATERSCRTLPNDLRGDCMELCTKEVLSPQVRSCMAETDDCGKFSDCADLQPVTAPMSAFEAAASCDKSKKVHCPRSPDCSFPQVCCTQIFGGGGRSTRIHLCGVRDCPWYYFGQGPWCGCPRTKDVYGCG